MNKQIIGGTGSMLLEGKFLRRLEKLELVLNRKHSQHLVGKRSGRTLGGGLEFSDYRQYQVGDDYRYIDWNIYSRLGQLFLKQYIEERDALIYLLIDASRSMGFGQPTKLEVALKTAGALGYIGLYQQDQVGAATFASVIAPEFRPRKGLGYAPRMFHYLEEAVSGGDTAINDSLARFAPRYRVPGLLIIISDLLDREGYREGLRELRKKGWEIVLIHILDEGELDPDFGAGSNLQLIDAETGRKKWVSINAEILKQYRTNLGDFLSGISDFTSQMGIRYQRISTADSLEEIIFRKLYRKRGVR